MTRSRLPLLVPLLALAGRAAAFDSFANDGCTSIIVGRDATVSGGTMTSHTDDCMECDHRISKVPAQDHAPNSTRAVHDARAAYPRYLGYDRGSTYLPSNTDTTIYPWEAGKGPFEPIGFIPQVEHTYAYLDGGYGIINEHQVSMGESTCGALIQALPAHKGGKALLEMSELSRIGLERCKTALCAVKLMGALAEEYGYFGADETPGEAGESMQVIDPHEAWVFHILADDTGTSAVWAAQRVPHGHVSAVANQFVIRTLDLDDPANYLASANMVDVAQRAGLYDPDADGEFDFTRVFALSRGVLSPYATRRVWRVFDLVAPSLGLPGDTNIYGDDYPFSVKAERKLTPADLIEINRDHYEGTEYDMTKGLASGPYGDPSRFDPGGTAGLYHPKSEVVSEEEAWSAGFERAISIYRCAYSWVSESRSSVPGALGVAWFGQYAPHASSAVPIYVGGSDVPKAFKTGSLHKFSLESSYWIHAAIGNWADRLYVHTIGDIKALQTEIESALFEAQHGIEAAAAEMVQWAPAAQAVAFLDSVAAEASEAELDLWSEFLFTLIAKFKDGQRIDDFHGETLAPTKLFYPRWWLEAVGFLPPIADPAVEGAAAPAQADGAVSTGALGGLLLLTNLVVAALSVALTHSYLNSRKPGAPRLTTSVTEGRAGGSLLQQGLGGVRTLVFRGHEYETVGDTEMTFQHPQPFAEARPQAGGHYQAQTTTLSI